MRTFPAAFTAALAKNSGTPIWILSLISGGVTYYLSDQGRSIPTWNGGVTLRPWVTFWGQVTESLGLGHREINVSDFSGSFRIDPSASPNMETIASADDIEASPATLYFWFVGLDPATDPPQALWSGYVDDVEIPDDATVTMTFEDGSSRLGHDLGTVVTTAVYPTADPDDVGKILPIAFGVVKNLPPVATAAGRLTTLTAEISAAATSVTVLSVEALTVNDYCDVGAETIKITAINSGTLTLTISRAQNSTLAAPHLKGEALIQQLSLYKLIVHDGAVTTIDRVILRSGVDIEVTDLVTRYTGQAGSIHTATGYTGKAVLTLTPAQIEDVRDRLDGVTGIIDPTHGHASALTSKAIRPDFFTVISGMWYNQSVPVNPSTDPYNAVDGRPTTYVSAETSGVTCDFSYSVPTGSTGTPKRVRIGAQAPNVSVTGATATISLRSGTTQLVSASLPDNSLVYSSWYTLPTQTWAAVEAYKIRYVGGGSGQYSMLSDIWMEVEFDPSSPNTSTGITINSGLDNALGGHLLVDVTAILSTPLAVTNDLLGRGGQGATATLTGTFPAGYAVNGAILKPRPLINILNQIAFECRAWFRYLSGIPRLIVRPDTLTSVRTLSACAVDANLMRQYSRKKTVVDNILNTITLRYGRDYSKDGDEAYTLTSDDSDSASVAVHGVKADDDLFRCDFIATAAMADSVRDYYLGRYAQRGWEHRFSVFLDQLALEFGDGVALGFAGNVVGEVLESRLTPGQGETIDRIELVVEVPPPPPPPSLWVTTFDPAKKDSGATLSNGDKTVQFNNQGGALVVGGKTSGVWRVKVSVDQVTSSRYSLIGFADAIVSAVDNYPGWTGYSIGYSSDGYAVFAGGSNNIGRPFAAGSEIWLEINAATRTSRMSNDLGVTWSVWSSSPITGTGALYIMAGSNSNVMTVSLIP